MRNGRPKCRAIWPVQSSPMPDSGVPNVGEPGLHVDVGQERPEDDRTAGPDQLRQRDAGEGLGDLLDQRGRDGDRRHRAHQDERRQHDRLVGRGVLELRLEHPGVPAQRRVAVDQRDRRRGLLDDVAPAEQDRGHGDRVGRVDARHHVAHVDLVGQRLQGEGHVEVAAVERGVVRLAHHAAGRVQHAVRLGEPREVLEVRHRRVAAYGALADERRAVDGAERHRVAADVDVVVVVARLDVELARRLRDLREHELGIEEDLVLLDPLPGLTEQGEGAVVHELHADLAHQASPPGVQLRHRVFREHLVARHAVAEHASSVSFVRRGRAGP